MWGLILTIGDAAAATPVGPSAFASTSEPYGTPTEFASTSEPYGTPTEFASTSEAV